ncbi:MAG TPA: hypothetical protein EYG70_03895 [Sulfurimonas sp.]|nr:hypothetical protein [Sulfurimonas sp.]
MIKSLTQGLTEGSDRDLKILQTDLIKNLEALEDIDERNKINDTNTDEFTGEIHTLGETMNS